MIKKLLFICCLSLFMVKVQGQSLTAFKDEKGKWGYKDASGKVVIPPKYIGAEDFTEGLGNVTMEAKVVVEYGNTFYDDAKWGYIDATGKIVIPLKYKYSYPFKNGLAMVTINDNNGLIDLKGNAVTPIKYKVIDDFIGDLARVAIGDAYGFINKQGKEVIPVKYYQVGDFYNGLATAGLEADKTIGFIDQTGKMVIPAVYTNHNERANYFHRFYEFKNGICKVDRAGKLQLINDKGVAFPDELIVLLKLIFDDSLNGLKNTTGTKVIKANAAGKPLVYNALHGLLPGSDSVMVADNGIKTYLAHYKVDNPSHLEKIKTDVPEIRDLLIRMGGNERFKMEQMAQGDRKLIVLYNVEKKFPQVAAELHESPTRILFKITETK